MELEVIRFSSSNDDTLGILRVNGAFECFTLEDEKRTVKVMGETRIPEGRYQVKLRKTGGFHNRYGKKYGSWHKGMLHVTNVPNFQYVLIHIGNDEDDTAGCLLVGQTATSNLGKMKGFVGASGNAYKRLYPQVLAALEAGEDVWITYKELL